MENLVSKNKEIPIGRAEDLRGKKFNKLTPLYRTLNKGKKVVWHCRCECGNECDVLACHLKDGSIKSCGCFKRTVSNYKDITGQRFGKLVALYPINLGKGERIKWHCKCDCGNECDVSENHLAKGATRSCGCVKSYGESRIVQILNYNHISYITQYSFSNCRFPDTNSLAFFDFYVDNKFLIEFDGEQHFKLNGGWNDEEHFYKLQQHDNYKNQWCKEHNIPLIRIPYTQLKNLSIEDLMLETSTYRVC